MIWKTLKKAKEDLLIPEEKRKEYRAARRQFEGPDRLKQRLTTAPGVSNIGIEVRRGDPKVKGGVAHGYQRVFEDPSKHIEQAKRLLSESKQKDTQFEDPWDQAKHDREHLDKKINKKIQKGIKDDALSSLPDVNDNNTIEESFEFGQDKKNPISASTLLRHYKHSPHHPASLALKYIVHRLENADSYKDPVKSKKLDSDFMKLHQQGKAVEKNGHIGIEDLHSFTKKHGKKLMGQLLWHKKKLHDTIKNASPWAVKEINGEPHVALTRGLNTRQPGKEHALASYGDVKHTGFGDVMHHRWVPLKNVWYSYDAGHESSTSPKYGNENEFLVSPHKIRSAQEKDVLQLVPRGHHSYGNKRDADQETVHALTNPNVTNETIDKAVSDYNTSETVLYKLSSLSNLHPDIQHKLLEHPNFTDNVLNNLIRNSNVHMDVQHKIAKDPNVNPIVLASLAEKANDHHIQEKIFNNSGAYFRTLSSLAANPNLHPDLHAKIADHPKVDPYVLGVLSQRPDLSIEAQHKIIDHPTKRNENILNTLAENKNLHHTVRSKLIGRPDITEWGLTKLAENPNLTLDDQQKIINHPKTNDGVLAALARKSEHPEIHQAILNHPWTNVHVRHALSQNTTLADNVRSSLNQDNTEKLAASESKINDSLNKTIPLTKAPIENYDSSIAREAPEVPMRERYNTKSKSTEVAPGMYHHALFSNRNQEALHMLSNHPDPFAKDATIYSQLLGDTEKFTGAPLTVQLSQVHPEHKGKGHGKALYGLALQHHGELHSDELVSPQADDVYRHLQQKGASVKLGAPETRERHKAKATPDFFIGSPNAFAKSTKLEHYSKQTGLSSINPAFQGTGTDRAVHANRKTEHPHSFFYLAGTEPEHIVRSGAKSKYSVDLPETAKIYDMGTDPDKIIENLKAESASRPVNPGLPYIDDIHSAIKSAGYQGFKNSKHEQLPNVVALYHEVPVGREEKL